MQKTYERLGERPPVGTEGTDSELHYKLRRYEKMFSLAEDGILLHEPMAAGGRFIEANPAICRLLGYTRTEMLRRSPMDIVAAEDQPNLPRDFKRLRQNGVLRHEKILAAKDGRRIPVEIVTRQFDENGRTKIISIVRDISERKRTEAALRTSEERLKVAKESASLGIYDYDVSTDTIYWDERVRALWGVGPEEAISFEKFVDGLHPEDAARVQDVIDQNYDPRSGGCYYTEYRVINRRDGGEHWVAATGAVIFEGERPVRVVGTVQDISDRRRIAEALRQSEERLKIAKESASLGIYDYNLTTGATYWDERIRDLWGIGREEPVTYETFVAGLHPDDRARMETAIQEGIEAQRHGKPYSVEYRVINRRDGTMHWIAGTGAVFFEADQPVRIVGTVLDISERKRTEAALRQSEERLRLFIEHAPVALAMFDRQMCYLSASRRWLSDFGLEKDELHGRCHYEVFSEISEEWKAIHRRALAGEVVRAEEDRFQRADGSVQWLRWEVRPWYAGAEQVGGIIIFTEDITERKRAEEALRYSQKMLSGAEALSHTGAWEWEIDADRWTFSQEWQAIHGCYRWIMTSRDLLPLAHDEDRRAVMRALVRVRRGEVPYDIEYRIIRQDDGRERFVHARGQVIRDEEDRIVKAYGVTQDITERKQTELELRRTLGLLEGITQGAQDQIAAEDTEFRYTYFNEAYRQEFKRLWGIDLEVGMSMIDVLAPWPEAQQAARELWSRAMGGESFHMTMAFGRTEEEKQIYYLWYNPIFDAQQRQIGAGHIMHNITEQVQVQRALEEFNELLERRVAERTEEVQEKARQLRALAIQLGQVQQAERKRLAKILHDHIQQLIVAARMQLGWMEHIGDPAEVQATTQEVDRILQEALTASRSLAVDLSPPVLHESGLTGGLHWLVSDMLKKNQFRIHLLTDPRAEPQTEEIRLLLFECVRELLFNAVKHSGVSEAEVTLMRTDEQHIRLVVSDQGRGFDPDLLRRRQAGEVSFGLFSIQERLTHIGGRMEIETAPGRGARVTLNVPAAEVESQGRSALESMQADQREEHIRVRPKTNLRSVLIVDDHKIMREGLKRLLRFESDIEVVGEAEDGPRAIELAGELQPDVVIMDVNLGEMSGVEATRQITSHHPRVKVIGLSMHADPSVADSMRSAGAAAYLTKSGPSEELVAAVRGCRPAGE